MAIPRSPRARGNRASRGPTRKAPCRCRRRRRRTRHPMRTSETGVPTTVTRSRSHAARAVHREQRAAGVAASLRAARGGAVAARAVAPAAPNEWRRRGRWRRMRRRRRRRRRGRRRPRRGRRGGRQRRRRRAKVAASAASANADGVGGTPGVGGARGRGRPRRRRRRRRRHRRRRGGGGEGTGASGGLRGVAGTRWAAVAAAWRRGRRRGRRPEPPRAAVRSTRGARHAVACRVEFAGLRSTRQPAVASGSHNQNGDNRHRSVHPWQRAILFVRVPRSAAPSRRTLRGAGDEQLRAPSVGAARLQTEQLALLGKIRATKRRHRRLACSRAYQNGLCDATLSRRAEARRRTRARARGGRLPSAKRRPPAKPAVRRRR